MKLSIENEEGIGEVEKKDSINIKIYNAEENVCTRTQDGSQTSKLLKFFFSLKPLAEFSTYFV